MRIVYSLLSFFSTQLCMALIFTTSLLMIAFSIIAIFLYVPDDYLQGNLIKIMYVHVPFAWLSMLMYTIFSIASLIFIIKKIILFDIIAHSISKILLSVVFMTLLTGSIWGRPAWGTWWVWDARLTSMLVLFFIVASYLIVRGSLDHEELRSKISSILAIVGFLNIPLIKFSVDIWNTLHQKSTFLKAGGSAIHASMMYPVITMFFGISLLLTTTIISNIKLELLSKKLKRVNL